MEVIEFGKWIEGNPDVPCWCIAAVRSNDEAENYYVLQLWFNPNSIDKWYVGGGYVSSYSQPFHSPEKIKFWMPLPPQPGKTHGPDWRFEVPIRV